MHLTFRRGEAVAAEVGVPAEALEEQVAAVAAAVERLEEVRAEVRAEQVVVSVVAVAEARAEQAARGAEAQDDPVHRVAGEEAEQRSCQDRCRRTPRA